MNSPLQGYKIGFIGLGFMGDPMARHLHKGGATVFIHNRSQERAKQIVADHPAVQNLSSAEQVATSVPAGIIVTMLTNTPAVETVMTALLPAVSPGTLVIDMSTTGVTKTRELAAEFREKGCGYVDGPVSGGEVGAKEASLAIMAGGSDDDFTRAEPIFEVLGSKATHLGPVGAGQITKLANQTIVGIGVAALAEALALAEAAGVDPAKVRDAIRGGFAESRLLAEHGERMVTGNFEPGGKAAYQLKDVREAKLVAEESGIELPMLFQNVAQWEKMVDERGEGAVDHSGILRMYREARPRK